MSCTCLFTGCLTQAVSCHGHWMRLQSYHESVMQLWETDVQSVTLLLGATILSDNDHLRYNAGNYVNDQDGKWLIQ